MYDEPQAPHPRHGGRRPAHRPGPGRPVYDAATQSAYLGPHKSETPAVYLDELDYFSGTEGRYFYTSATENDNLNQSHSRCITRSFDRTYKLNGQHTSLTGNIYQSYESRSYDIWSGSGLWIYGDGKLLYAKEFLLNTTGFEPEAIDIDLSGVLELQVKFDCRSVYGNNSSNPLSLGEMALYT